VLSITRSPDALESPSPPPLSGEQAVSASGVASANAKYLVTIQRNNIKKGLTGFF